jgi:hypothetical protein
MKKHLLAILSLLFISASLTAQTTNTYVVADNGPYMMSCSDTLITLADIYEKTGIRDLNDPNDNVSMYKMFRLQGSVITEDELTSIKYSDYSAVFIKKMNATAFPNSGVQIFLYVTIPPDKLFTADTLRYTVEKGATKNYTEDFFGKFIFFSSNNDETALSERILFTDESAGPGTGTESPISAVPNWSIRGAGKYKIKVQVSVCNPLDYFYDSIYVIITETPCLRLEIKDMPSVCRDEVLDLTPYVYLDGHAATASELAQMTFINKSLLSGPEEIFDPTMLDMTQMVNKTTRFPQIKINYQPNVDLGICTAFTYAPALTVPTKLITTDIILTKNNYGNTVYYTVDGDYYGFNDMFEKNVLKKLYLDNFAVHSGTRLDFYTDAALATPVIGNNLTPGTYYIAATDPECANDSTKFTINVKNKAFDIFWKSAPALGKGYYTFTAPVTEGAAYSWFVWGGSIVSGLNTNEVTVYYSEDAAPSVLVSCTITVTPANTRTNAVGTVTSSAVYITSDQNGDKVEITPELTTPIISSVAKSSLTAYPNPAKETFSLSGSGVYDVKIYNTLGQLVFANASYEATTPITLENKGLHVVYVTQKGISQVVKVIAE